MQITMFNISTIELCVRFVSNGNSRRIRITGQQYIKDELIPSITEITLYGNTESLEALPNSSDFRDQDARTVDEPRRAAQIDIEDYLAAAPTATQASDAVQDDAMLRAQRETQGLPADMDETEIDF